MRSLFIVIGFALWGAAIWAASQLHRVDLPFAHNFCGPWGCAAEPGALLGAHLIWLTLLGPTLVIACRTLGPPYGTLLANAAWKVGLLAAVVLVLGGSIAWLRAGEPREHAAPRGLFLLATTPDLPAIPLALAGLAARFSNRRTAEQNREAQPVDLAIRKGETREV